MFRDCGGIVTGGASVGEPTGAEGAGAEASYSAAGAESAAAMVEAAAAMVEAAAANARAAYVTSVGMIATIEAGVFLDRDAYAAIEAAFPCVEGRLRVSKGRLCPPKPQLRAAIFSLRRPKR